MGNPMGLVSLWLIWQRRTRAEGFPKPWNVIRKSLALNRLASNDLAEAEHLHI